MHSDDMRLSKLRALEGTRSEAGAGTAHVCFKPRQSDARETVARLFSEHNAALLRFLRLRLSSTHEAREVAQEAYVRLLQLDHPGAVSFLRAYLFRIAANLATDRLRRGSVRQASHTDPALEIDTADERDPERAILAREQLALIDASLRELPGKVRKAFLLHRLHGFSVAEVGARMGVSERTARNYVIDAMVCCRKRLESAEGTAS